MPNCPHTPRTRWDVDVWPGHGTALGAGPTIGRGRALVHVQVAVEVLGWMEQAMDIRNWVAEAELSKETR